MDGPAIHFNIGVAAYRAGQYEKARAAFERVALTPAMAPLARYNLGLVALAQDQEQQAIDHFARAYAESDDERVRALARAQLDSIGSEPPRPSPAWALYGSTGIGYDDNVTLTSGSQALGVARDGDVYGDTLLAGSVQITDSLRLDADASFLNYADLDEFDQWGIGVGGRYRIATESSTLDVGAQLGTTYIDGERLDARESAYVQGSRALSSLWSLRARYRLSNVDGGDDYPGLEGLRHELTARLTRRGSVWTTSIGYAFEVNDYDSAALSAVRHQVSTDAQMLLSRLWTARASLSYRSSDYDDASIGAERRIEVGAAAEYLLSERWTLTLHYLFSDNDADAPELAYRRNRVFLGLDAMF